MRNVHYFNVEENGEGLDLPEIFMLFLLSHKINKCVHIKVKNLKRKNISLLNWKNLIELILSI